MYYVLDGTIEFEDPTVATFETYEKAREFLDEWDNGDYYISKDDDDDDNYDDYVDESNYDPYMGCDFFEVDECF